MSGRDLRVGFVRARQVGSETGASLVRRTVSSFTIIRDQPTVLGMDQRLTFTALDNVQMTGFDSHLVIPIAQIGERVQLGFLGAGGIAWIPDVPIQKRIDGPPFYADDTMGVPLTSPPPSGGFVGDFVQPVPLVPGTTYGVTTGSSVRVLSHRLHVAADSGAVGRGLPRGSAAQAPCGGRVQLSGHAADWY